ncbi:unnamed protein product, partial [Iphiclides podalirius]
MLDYRSDGRRRARLWPAFATAICQLGQVVPQVCGCGAARRRRRCGGGAARSRRGGCARAAAAAGRRRGGGGAGGGGGRGARAAHGAIRRGRRPAPAAAATAAPPPRTGRAATASLSASRVVARVARVANTVTHTSTRRCRCEHAAAEAMPAEEEAAAMDARDAADGSPQQFCLRWNNYQSNLANCFDQLLQTESFVDVTLACEGQSLKAHKVVLSACSPYFQTLFMDNPCRHPIIIMRDIKYCDLKAVVDFMYRGEINVSQDQITALLKVAEMLKIRGLTDVSGEQAVLRAGGGEMRAPKRPVSRETDSPSKARRRSAEGPSPPADLLPPDAPAPLPLHTDDIDIRPGIAEMIREEERVSVTAPQPQRAAATRPHAAPSPRRRPVVAPSRAQLFPPPARAPPPKTFPLVSRFLINSFRARRFVASNTKTAV